MINSSSSTAKKANNMINKWIIDLNKHFSKDIQKASRYMKKCSSTSLIIKIQIEATRRYHPTPVRMVIKKIASAGEDVEKIKPLHIVGGDVN